MNGSVPLYLQVSFVHRWESDPQLLFSSRADVVIGDVLIDGAMGIVDTINKLPPGSGRACWKRCDVSKWEDQVALFELAMKKFGGVDIVVSVAFYWACTTRELIWYSPHAGHEW